MVEVSGVTDIPSNAPPSPAAFNFDIVDECSGLVSFSSTSLNSSNIMWFLATIKLY